MYYDLTECGIRIAQLRAESGLTQLQAAEKLNISVQQVDASAFPNVRLYLRVEDALSGEVPVLDDILFFIRKQDANANFVKQQISRVSQLH